MKELELNFLTLEQKLGMVMTANCLHSGDDFNFTLDLIRNHALGSIWLLPDDPQFQKKMDAIHAAADYPILIVTDAEGGLGRYKIGLHGTLGYINNPKLAYKFGRITGIAARKMGYNLVCNPVIDIVQQNGPTSAPARSMGSSPERVAEYAVAMVRGMHDAGVLSMAKHYPGANSLRDTHMCEGLSDIDQDYLLDVCLMPYKALMKEGLLDSVMAGHTRIPSIDEQYPTSLSSTILNIIRNIGFDGMIMTDAMVMMGVVAKYGYYHCKGMAIAAGNDTILGWETPNKKDYDALQKAYADGVISETRLNDAVRHVLELQHKSTLLPMDAEITEEDEKNFLSILHDSIASVTDEGTPVSIDPMGKHCFVILEENLGQSASNQTPSIDPTKGDWYDPNAIEERIHLRFPNSCVKRLNEFPTVMQNLHFFEEQLSFEDVIYVTFAQGGAYVGTDHFTSKVLSVMEALQVTDRISTIVHFGNPFVLDETPHIPRRLMGGRNREITLHAIDVLAGLATANGRVPFKLNLA